MHRGLGLSLLVFSTCVQVQHLDVDSNLHDLYLFVYCLVLSKYYKIPSIVTRQTHNDQSLIRLMAYRHRHSLNKKKKKTKTATLAPRPTAEHVAKIHFRLATTLDDGSLVEHHQNSVFNDPVVK